MSRALRFAIPGRPLAIEHLALDVNGTLANRGALIAGVRERLQALAKTLELHLLSAGTFGVLRDVSAALGVEAHVVANGDEKAGYVRELGADRSVAIGNGENDRAMLEAAALGIAVLGPEGAALAALQAADIVCPTILDALGLLLDERALIATLRP